MKVQDNGKPNNITSHFSSNCGDSVYKLENYYVKVSKHKFSRLK